MNPRSVPAGNGVNWITEAVQIIFKNPAAFLLMGLIFTVIAIVPILGSLALAIISPALYAGIAWGARVQNTGGQADVGQLFQGFKEEGKVGPLLLLCLPGLAIGFLLGIFIVVLVLIAAAGVGISSAMESPEAMIASLGLGLLVLLPVGLIGLLLSFVLTFFAVPDVMFSRNDAFAAMKDSARACIANIGAILLYLLVMVIGAVVLAVVLSIISSLLAQILISIILAPVAGVSMYLAWRDVYGDDAAQMIEPTEFPADPAPPQDGGGMVA